MEDIICVPRLANATGRGFDFSPLNDLLIHSIGAARLSTGASHHGSLDKFFHNSLS